MPIERSQVDAVLRSIKVDYYGNSLTITYRPDTWSPVKIAETARVRQLEAENRNGDENAYESLARTLDENATDLANVLVSWDMIENGEPLPPTKENLMTFANALLQHVLTAIGEDMAPKARTTRR
jgi:hypothetical protein